MVALLGQYADAIDAERSGRAVNPSSEGKAFYAGSDIVAGGGLSALEMGQGRVRSEYRVFDKLARLKPPVIAAINRHALRGRLELAVIADVRVCEIQVKIGPPESGHGIIDELVEKGGAMAAKAIAQRVLTRRLVANIVVKQLINAAEDEDRAPIIEALATSFISYADDVKEGVAAFISVIAFVLLVAAWTILSML